MKKTAQVLLAIIIIFIAIFIAKNLPIFSTENKQCARAIDQQVAPKDLSKVFEFKNWGRCL